MSLNVAPSPDDGANMRKHYAVMPRTVLDDRSLSDAAVRLFGVLDARITGKGSQQLRQDTIAEQLGWSRRKVQRALAELIAHGLVTAKHTARSSRLSVVNPVRDAVPRQKNGSQRQDGIPTAGASNMAQ